MGVAVKKEWVEEACAHGWRDRPRSAPPATLEQMLRSLRNAIRPMTAGASGTEAPAKRSASGR